LLCLRGTAGHQCQGSRGDELTKDTIAHNGRFLR
jgi:hypothetical protein